MTTSPRPLQRLYALDALRGLAALSVVVFHWQHFFFAGHALTPAYDVTLLPFTTVLRPLYDFGYLAVDLFFGISGFVMFWLYGQDIASGRTSFRVFGLRRLSRLYPLHIATLAIVLVEQTMMKAATGSTFVYAWYDLRHFVLNLFMASSWGFERDMSFNGPAWSISVEILLYAVFFLWARRLPRVPWLMLGTALLGRVLFLGYFPIGQGLWSFFIGAAIARWYAVGHETARAPTAARWLPWLTLALWVLTLLWVYGGLSLRVHAACVGQEPWVPRVLKLVEANWPRTLLMPLTICTTLLVDRRFGERLHRLATLGEISYSSYLLHFPLQLAVVLVLSGHVDMVTFFRTPVALVGFMALLVAMSVLSYRAFERPVQDLLRRRFRA